MREDGDKEIVALADDIATQEQIHEQNGVRVGEAWKRIEAQAGTLAEMQDS